MKAVLNYFVRKAFAPLRERLAAIQSNIQEVYEWLYGRLSADHLPRRMPIVEREGASSAAYPVAQNTDNLLRHLALLNGRKISNSYADGTAADDGLPDGVSLARLLCDSTLQPSELIDDNVGWTMTKALSGSPNLKRLTILGKGYLGNKWIANMENLEELNIPNIQGQSAFESSLDIATMPAGISNLAKLKRLHAEDFSSIAFNGNGNQYSAAIAGCPELEEVWLGKVTNTNHPGWGETKWVIQYCENLQYLHVEEFVTNNCTVRSGQNNNLVLIEICKEQTESCNLNWWSPTTAISERLPEFLSNFQTYIADRVIDMTGQTALTLTLSSAVYAVLEAQEGQTILATLTNKNWTVASA